MGGDSSEGEEVSDDLAVIQDLRRDAQEVLWTEIAQHIPDIGLEDLPTEEDIHMFREDYDDERWTGFYQTDTNLEKIYEVSYRFDAEKFYVTTYTMTYCNKHEPPHLY